jgi:hypothetical protein
MKHIKYLLISACVLSCSPSGTSVTPVDTARPHLIITIAYNTESYHRFIVKLYPQMALWLREKKSGAVKTIFVTEKGARGKWIGASRRPDAMPVWYGLRDEEKKSGRAAEIDAVTRATPSGDSFTIPWQVPPDLVGKEAELYLEANISFDYNSFYRKDAPEDGPGYSGVNGQPSMVWMAPIMCGGPDKEYSPRLIGHGHVSGKGHEIERDLSKVTTAKGLFQYIKYEYKTGGKG